jgi:hypothetical protein
MAVAEAFCMDETPVGNGEIGPAFSGLCFDRRFPHAYGRALLKFVSVGCRLSRMRAYALTLSLLLAGGSTLLPLWSDAQSPVSVESRLAMQSALFDEYYQNRLKESPELATFLGDNGYNDRLDDHSLAGVVRRAATNDAFLARLKVISTAGLVALK